MYKDSLNADWSSIDSGGFRHQITLLEQITTTDASGSVTKYAIGSPPITAWAKIDYLRGAELIKAGQDVTQTFIKCISWFRCEFQANLRIQLPSGKRFRIQNVENVQEMSAYMVLTCLGLGENE